MARVKHMNAYILQKKSPKTHVPEKQEMMLNLKYEQENCNVMFQDNHFY